MTETQATYGEKKELYEIEIETRNLIFDVLKDRINDPSRWAYKVYRSLLIAGRLKN